MNIEQSRVCKTRITNVDGLDPITVYTENFEPGKGKIIIECFGKSWSSYWPAMGRKTIEQFFISINNGYAINNLAGNLNEEVDDEDAIEAMIKKQVIIKRKAKELNRRQASLIWSDVTTLSDLNTDHWFIGDVCELLFGCNSFELDLPQKPNHEYTYLERICDAVRNALIKLNTESEAI